MNNIILLVDDDTGFMEAVKEILNLEGYDVLEAVNGNEALTILESNPVDLMITDILMPEMDGVELSWKGNQIKPNLKTIGMTGEGNVLSSLSLEGMVKDLFNGFLIKPFNREELLSAMEKLLVVNHISPANPVVY